MYLVGESLGALLGPDCAEAEGEVGDHGRDEAGPVEGQVRGRRQRHSHLRTHAHVSKNPVEVIITNSECSKAILYSDRGR